MSSLGVFSHPVSPNMCNEEVALSKEIEIRGARGVARVLSIVDRHYLRRYLDFSEMEYLGQNVVQHTAKRIVRDVPTDFKNKSLFHLGNDRSYARQFFPMYEQRLKMLKPRVDIEATKIWGHNTREVNGRKIQHKEKILDIVSGELCWVSGTIFSDMKHKLNIFHDVDKGVDDTLPHVPKRYVDEENNAVVMIEDESGRAILHNPELLRSTALVTGCVVGVLGIEIQAGVFEIMEVVYPTPAHQEELDASAADDSDEWIALVSGLQVDKETNLNLKTVLLQQWLRGELGGEVDLGICKSISRLVLVGNSISQAEPEVNTDFSTTNNFGSKNTSRFSPESLLLFNQWLGEILATMPVTILPGESDPCELCLPQQPMHRFLFGKNSCYVNTASLTTVTNPSWMVAANGARILLSSGQNIDDIMKYSTNDSSDLSCILDTMYNTLKWQNIVPTAPDTLYCYPFEDRDPFTLDETPHLYVVGNQAKSGARSVSIGNYSVKMVSVSVFDKTGEITLVNPRTFETRIVKVC